MPYDLQTGRTVITNYMDEDRVGIQALRLGLQGKATFNSFIDFRGEVAWVPYAHVAGTITNETVGFSNTPYGGEAQPPYSGETGNISTINAITRDIDTWGYGGMAEAFIGFHPTENLVFRLGGRAWYVQGTTDSVGTAVSITDPSDSADLDPDYDNAPVVTMSSGDVPNRPFSFLRYGVLAEVAYSF